MGAGFGFTHVALHRFVTDPEIHLLSLQVAVLWSPVSVSFYEIGRNISFSAGPVNLLQWKEYLPCVKFSVPFAKSLLIFFLNLQFRKHFIFRFFLSKNKCHFDCRWLHLFKKKKKKYSDITQVLYFTSVLSLRKPSSQKTAGYSNQTDSAGRFLTSRNVTKPK